MSDSMENKNPPNLRYSDCCGRCYYANAFHKQDGMAMATCMEFGCHEVLEHQVCDNFAKDKEDAERKKKHAL